MNVLDRIGDWYSGNRDTMGLRLAASGLALQGKDSSAVLGQIGAIQQDKAARKSAIDSLSQQMGVDRASLDSMPTQLLVQEAARQQFPQAMSPADRYKNVPGVGLVDIANPNGPSVTLAQQGPGQYRTLSPEEARRLGIPDGMVAQVGPDGQIRTVGSAQGSPIAALEARAQAAGLTPGSPEYADFMRTGGRVAQNGVTVEPDGTVRVGGPAELGTSARNNLDAKEINARDFLGRLDGIQQRIVENPDLLSGMTLMGDIQRMGMSWAEYIGGPGTLNKAQAEQLVQMTQLRSDVQDNLSRLVNELSGAAATDAEVQRISAQIPSVNDPPTQFLAKLRAATDRTRTAVARYNYWRNGGFEGSKTASEGASLSQMESIMQDNAAKLRKAVEDGKITPQQASAEFARKFGV